MRNHIRRNGKNISAAVLFILNKCLSLTDAETKIHIVEVVLGGGILVFDALYNKLPPQFWWFKTTHIIVLWFLKSEI
jgi:hypothetical protein